MVAESSVIWFRDFDFETSLTGGDNQRTRHIMFYFNTENIQTGKDLEFFFAGVGEVIITTLTFQCFLSKKKKNPMFNNTGLFGS